MIGNARLRTWTTFKIYKQARDFSYGSQWLMGSTSPLWDLTADRSWSERVHYKKELDSSCARALPVTISEQAHSWVSTGNTNLVHNCFYLPEGMGEWIWVGWVGVGWGGAEGKGNQCCINLVFLRSSVILFTKGIRSHHISRDALCWEGSPVVVAFHDLSSLCILLIMWMRVNSGWPANIPASRRAPKISPSRHTREMARYSALDESPLFPQAWKI